MTGLVSSLAVSSGTWTPGITAGTTPPTGVTYSLQVGQYSRVGNIVFCALEMRLTSVGTSGAGTVQITGLPFAASASVVTQRGLASCQLQTLPVGSTVMGWGTLGNTNLVLTEYNPTTGFRQNLDYATILAATAQFAFSFTYFAA